MAASSVTPEIGAIAQIANPSRWTSRDYGSIEPGMLAAAITAAKRGDLEQWADVCSYMLRTDAHVRSVWLTRVNSVAGARVEFEAGRAAPGQEQLAQAAADFCREQLMGTEELEDRLANLMHAVGVGVAALEHDWHYIGGVVSSTPRFIHPRDLRYFSDWTLSIRTYSGAGSFQWVKTSDHPNKFIVHVPQNIGDVPTLCGEFLPVAWAWMFKRWYEKFRANGLERFSNGLLKATVAPNAPAEARRALRAGLEAMGSDGIGIFEEGINVDLLELKAMPGEAWTSAIDSMNREISKAILGSGLNVEVDSTGGNRALGESQFATTILPRLQVDAKRLAGTIERDWLKPLLTFNAHLFGGVIPPTPRLVLSLSAEQPAPEPVQIDELLVRAGVVTVDELRISRGLQPLGPDAGGNSIAHVETMVSPQFGRVEVPDVPLAQSRRLSRLSSPTGVKSSTLANVSEMSTRSRSLLGAALSGKSGGHSH